MDQLTKRATNHANCLMLKKKKKKKEEKSKADKGYHASKSTTSFKILSPVLRKPDTSLHFSSSFPFPFLPSSTPSPPNLSPLHSLFLFPPTASSLLYSVSSLVVISFTFSSLFPLHFRGGRDALNNSERRPDL